jgi:hypothetical protein
MKVRRSFLDSMFSSWSYCLVQNNVLIRNLVFVSLYPFSCTWCYSMRCDAMQYDALRATQEKESKKECYAAKNSTSASVISSFLFLSRVFFAVRF